MTRETAPISNTLDKATICQGKRHMLDKVVRVVGCH